MSAYEKMREQVEYLVTVSKAMANKEPRDVFDWQLVHDRARTALANLCPKCGAGVSDCATFGCGIDPVEEEPSP